MPRSAGKKRARDDDTDEAGEEAVHDDVKQTVSSVTVKLKPGMLHGGAPALKQLRASVLQVGKVSVRSAEAVNAALMHVLEGDPTGGALRAVESLRHFVRRVFRFCQSNKRAAAAGSAQES